MTFTTLPDPSTELRRRYTIYSAARLRLPAAQLLRGVLAGWAIKTLGEIVMTPTTYIAVGFLKRAEGIDYYDTDTNFNPFIVTRRDSRV